MLSTVNGVRRLIVSQFLKSFVKDESGATAIEYGLIAAGISIVIVGAVQLIGPRLDTTFDNIAAALAPPA